ncbi:MAG: hypothetical protein QOC63_5715 [Mycobacterium sp.]|nr:hypothetical protein [Mycobacterium sp.]
MCSLRPARRRGRSCDRVPAGDCADEAVANRRCGSPGETPLPRWPTPAMGRSAVPMSVRAVAYAASAGASSGATAGVRIQTSNCGGPVVVALRSTAARVSHGIRSSDDPSALPGRDGDCGEGSALVVVGGLVPNGFVGPAFPSERHKLRFNGLGRTRRRGDSDELAEELRPSNSLTPPVSSPPARSWPVPP